MKFISLFLFFVTLISTAFAQSSSETNNKDEKSYNRWSFGVLYIPYYSGKIYTIEVSDYYPSQYTIMTTTNNENNMEAQLSFAVNEQIRITFDAAYTSTFYEQRSENHSRSENSNNDSGALDKSDLTLLDFNLGVKYYFKEFAEKKVSIYAIAGIGKQFAFAEQKYEELYTLPQPGTFSENNEDEFLEDSNSPFHLNFGFGAEYFFNESLSLNSNIRFIYTRVEADYDSRTISNQDDYMNSSTSTRTINYKKSDFITRIGLGVNFYF